VSIEKRVDRIATQTHDHSRSTEFGKLSSPSNARGHMPAQTNEFARLLYLDRVYNSCATQHTCGMKIAPLKWREIENAAECYWYLMPLFEKTGCANEL
jgi:hypothetical protein